MENNIFYKKKNLDFKADPEQGPDPGPYQDKTDPQQRFISLQNVFRFFNEQMEGKEYTKQTPLKNR